ncbi:tRNA pseudouridine synthase D [Macrolepiota fuliginosa MF-IS2]|uniref:tRNA pseudouridine synthase D n=1 Tax=Macrolepiota fuliginosa MF-IS2 TaxID=1400762 RepID=A0A9P5XJT0_9AGAR|nr:tRNA pseudouridine synthase D [Macrolepiota fuliginosa MF-IS2]
MSSIVLHEREQGEEDLERYSKRQKLDEDAQSSERHEHGHILPPSHALLGIPLPEVTPAGAIKFLETNVGISEYIGRESAKIQGIIKQRFTDFLVYEVDLDSNVIHLKSIDKPQSSKKGEEDATSVTEEVSLLPLNTSMEGTVDPKPAPDDSSTMPTVEPVAVKTSEANPWPENFNTTLTQFLSESAVEQLKTMWLEGPEPPRVSDSGWAGRTAKNQIEGEVTENAPIQEEEKQTENSKGSQGGRGGRGRRGGRPDGRKGRGGGREDNRKVITEPIDSKELRTSFHKTIRLLFNGRLDSETDTTNPSAEDGSRIVVRWGRRGGRGGASRGNAERAPRGTFPPYIHFTLQKTNRDTQDALGHLSRSLRVSVKDLSVAGTKDKRGVTVQRVAFKRGNKSVEDVWKQVNGLGRRPYEAIMKERGERGIRITDLNYRKASLELGMLKGNAFVITLRNVKVESTDILEEAMNTIKHKGFINYYGMQRFGTASVPTHSIGLALLLSQWQKAVDMILSKRHGEHPEVVAAREAWLEHGDLDRALELMPRRVVAERCILESYKKQKGETRNAMGAFSTIPKNLRLMYIHAYQSYVWNAIVSERIRTYGADKPIVGDLVLESGPENPTEVDAVEGEEQEEEAGSHRRSRKPFVPPRVRTLTEDDLDKYTIFDIVMPLPGTDVAYPGGKLGERYREFLRMDGLDPDNFVRKQRDYTLNGSYRNILHLPKELTWTVMHYTDPDVSLAQSDEDKLLEFDSPIVDQDGKFMALQIQLTLGTASYATMALREITKTDTSSHYQMNLTIASEDQQYKGTDQNVVAEAEGEDVENDNSL